jgi:tetratricopeptide (TPR) repeat protein
MPSLALAAACLGCFALCASLNNLSAKLSPAPPSLRQGRALSPDTAVEAVSLYSLGLRRAAADLGLIRMLIYYGTREDPHEHHEHAHAHNEGKHLELLPRALAIIDSDPSFTYASLYASGALAFNLDRTEEALQLLQYALSRDPGNFQLRSYVGAVGFHKKGDIKSVIALLEPALEYPDCPTMIKHLVAYLYRKDGRSEKARALYQEIRDESRDEGYRRLADAAMRELR